MIKIVNDNTDNYTKISNLHNNCKPTLQTLSKQIRSLDLHLTIFTFYTTSVKTLRIGLWECTCKNENPKIKKFTKN